MDEQYMGKLLVGFLSCDDNCCK
ncbi:unnamed protein product [Coffea canephora]|uniref:DH200=94 genomic scaffold, scaffold_454 n=1 Tax=Coffea canephora TaxID=49390 RepID=A0A068VFJ2_COFCA|nr:unnamed protein product [Coffea canephora]